MLLFVYTFISLVSIIFVSRRKITLQLWKIIVIAFSIRVIVLLLFINSRSDDINTFLRDGQYLIDRDPRYDASYFPFVSYLGMAALYFKHFIDPYLFLKIIFIILDVAIVSPLFFLAKKNSQSAFIYALNPITIIVAVVHGQIDSIPMFLLLLGILLFVRKKIISSVLVLSWAIYVKTWPLLFVVPIFKRAKNKLLFIFLPLIPTILTLIHSLIFPQTFLSIFLKVKNHLGIPGEWGIGKIFLNPRMVHLLSRFFIFIFAIFAFLRKDKDMLKEILIIMLFFFVFTPTFGIQWIAWLVPFILLVRPKMWIFFLIIASVYVTLGFVWDADSYFHTIMPIWTNIIAGAGFVTWIFITYLFFAIIDI